MTLTLLPAVDVADGQAVRLVQGAAGSETVYGDPLDAALAWQRRRRRVDPPRRPRRRVRPGLQRRAARRRGRAARRHGGAVRRHPRRRLAARRAGHRRGPGQHRHRRAGGPGTGATGSSASTATGSRSGSTCAATRCRRGAGPGTAATCSRCWSGWRRPAAARYVVTDVHRDGTLTGPNLELLREVCAAHRPAGDRQRRRVHAGRPARAGHAGADGRRGRDRRQGALRRRVHRPRGARMLAWGRRP